MADLKHLWEADHSYYCNPGNYLDRDGSATMIFESFDDFLTEWGDADRDYNLLFRWDWKEDEVPGEGGKLQTFWMLQRKGHYMYCECPVNRKDEDRVREFLKPCFEHLKTLWEPL